MARKLQEPTLGTSSRITSLSVELYLLTGMQISFMVVLE